MKKTVVLLTGLVFILGMMLPLGYAQLKQEKQLPTGTIPKQKTIHLKETDDATTKKMQEDIKALKGEQKAPAASEQKAPAASEQKALTTAPADTKAPAAQPTKKDKKAKKTKKTKKAPTN